MNWSRPNRGLPARRDFPGGSIRETDKRSLCRRWDILDWSGQIVLGRMKETPSGQNFEVWFDIDRGQRPKSFREFEAAVDHISARLR